MGREGAVPRAQDISLRLERAGVGMEQHLATGQDQKSKGASLD